MHGVPNKRGHVLVTIILSNLTDLQFFSLKDSLVNLQLMHINIPPHLHVATLPCETLMSAKQAVNFKLQGSVAAYLRCGVVINN